MASRSFQPTPAFRKKEELVRQSVMVETKEKLHGDVEKLFQDTQYSDLVLSVDSKHLPLHSFILKARYPEFYKYCQDRAKGNEVNITGLSFEELETCLRSVYSKDNIDYLNVEKALSLKGSRYSVNKTASLSDDLLQLVDGNTGDVEFLVEGKAVKAHRAILASRCDYFAAMFSSSWKETSSSSVAISDVSYDVFVAALKFLYGACQDILSLKTSKVLQFADMYGMQILQSLVISHLKITKCHLFHKPCPYCIPQVYECLKYCEVFYQLDALKLPCIRWVSKNFEKTLACKQFAMMSESFQKNVRVEIEKQITESKALEVWNNCNALITSVHSYQVKWAHSVRDFVEDIQATCLTVAIEHFTPICNSPIIDAFFKEINYSSSLLEQFLNAILDKLNVQNCCEVLQGFLILVEVGKHPSFRDPFDSGTFAVVEKSCQRCEKFIIGSIGQVAKTKSWASISASKQKELKNAAFFVDL